MTIQKGQNVTIDVTKDVTKDVTSDVGSDASSLSVVQLYERQKKICESIIKTHEYL